MHLESKQTTTVVNDTGSDDDSDDHFLLRHKVRKRRRWSVATQTCITLPMDIYVRDVVDPEEECFFDENSISCRDVMTQTLRSGHIIPFPSLDSKYNFLRRMVDEIEIYKGNE